MLSLKLYTLSIISQNSAVFQATNAFPDTVYPAHTTQSRMASHAADDIAWEYVTALETPHRPAIQAALTRIVFADMLSPTPLHSILQNVAEQTRSANLAGKSLLVVTGRSRRLAVESHAEELRKVVADHHLVGGDLSKTVGDVATAIMTTSAQAVLVLQEANCMS